MLDPRIGTALYRAAESFAYPKDGANDWTLLERFTRDRDPGAFAELLTRHGPAVWSVCRRVTGNEADAEDTFQATFLVLARESRRVRKGASVGSWLYGVAVRIGRKARTRRERSPDPARLTTPAAPPEAGADLSWSEIRAALDEELARLPDDLRAVVLLCYFRGLTQDEAAAELGWVPRTVKARVARARDLLRARLTRRGVELPAALAVPLLTAELASAVPRHLYAALTTAAPGIARGGSPGPNVSPAAVSLARTEVSTVPLLRLAVLLTTAAGLLAAGVLLGRPAEPLAPAERAAQVPAPPKTEPDTKLPVAGVQIGTKQFRQVGWHSRVFFADGGRTLVTVGESGSVRFWDLQRGETVHEIALKGNHHDAVATPDGSLLAVAGSRWPDGDNGKGEGALWLIDTATRKVRHAVGLPENFGSNHQQVGISSDGKRAVVEYEGDVRVIDTMSGEELLRHKGRINAGTLAVSPDGKLIAFGRYDLYLWKWGSGEEPKKFARVAGFGVETAGFTSDGKSLLAVSAGGRLVALDTTTGRQIGTFDLGGTPWKWAFNPDGRTLAVVYIDSSSVKAGHAVVLWDLSEGRGKEVGRFPVGRSAASHVSWSADGTRLAAATDYRLWAWDVKTKNPLGASAPGHEGVIGAFAFGPTGTLYTASDDHTVRSWDPVTGKPGLELIHDSWVRDVAVSPDGALVAGSALRNDLRIWTASGAEKFRLLGNGEMGGKRRVRFTPDGKRLVAWGDDFYLRVWDTRNGKLLAEHRTLPNGVTETQLDDDRTYQRLLLGFEPVDISADGTTFAFGQSTHIRFVDVITGKERAKLEVGSNGFVALALSPNGKRLVGGGRGKSVETRLPDGLTHYSLEKKHRLAVWDIATKKVVWEATVPGSQASQVGFSPDGTKVAEIVTDGEKPEVRLWDAESGKVLGRIELPGSASHFSFDRTGRRLAVSFRDTTAALYELETALKPVKDK